MFDVVGVGANSLDYVYRLPDFPAPEGPKSKRRIMQHAISPGGQTATTLCTCAAMGLEPTYVGAAGNDDNGELIRDELTNRSVDVSHLAIRDTDNAFAVILLNEKQGERVVLWHRKSELDLEPEEIDPDVIGGARLVHVDDVDEGAAILAASLARASGIPVTSDIERVGARTRELLSFVTIPIFAEHVLGALTGEQEFERGLRAVQAAHHDMACVTLGARGAMMLSGDRLYRVAGIPVDVVDSTGAGDIFRGAFIYALLRGDAPRDILRFANAAAAISCTRVGAMSSVPTLSDVEAFVAATKHRGTEAPRT
jgi:sulfofructose kinase